MSQLDLACNANISVRQLGFIETGRARPAGQLLLHLAACLDIPLRERNALLHAAGFAEAYPERAFDEPDLAPVRRSVEAVLAGFEPHPALALDRHWTMLAANRALPRLVAGAESLLLRPPVNLLRLALHPAGLAPRIVNLAEWRDQMLARLRRQIAATGDAALQDLLEELWDYPCPRGKPPEGDVPSVPAIPLRLATIDGELSFHGTSTVICMPADITVSELTIEAFLPADAHTASVMRQALPRERGVRTPAIAVG